MGPIFSVFSDTTASMKIIIIIVIIIIVLLTYYYMLLIRSRYIAIYEVTTEGILPNMVIYTFSNS